MTTVSNEELLHQFRHCFNLIRRRHHSTVHGRVGTRQGQGKILSILRRENGICQKDLAQKLQIRPASLSELLDKIQKSGWIRRQANENDRRKVNIYLTMEGQKVSQKMSEARQELADDSFHVLEDEEKKVLYDLLAKMINHLEEICLEDTAVEK